MDPDSQTSRQARGFCKDSYGVFCMLYNALSGKQVRIVLRINQMYVLFSIFSEFQNTKYIERKLNSSYFGKEFQDCFLYFKDKAADRIGGDDADIPSISAMNSLDSPMTPCPSGKIGQLHNCVFSF